MSTVPEVLKKLKKNKIETKSIFYFLVEYDLIYELNCLVLPMNAGTLCMKYFSVYEKCLGTVIKP